MPPDLLAFSGLIIVALAATILLTGTDWRISLLALAGLYIGVFLLVSINWSIGMAAAKLLAGWIAAAVLSMGIISTPMAARSPVAEAERQVPRMPITRWEPRPLPEPARSPQPRLASGLLFRFLAAALAALVALSAGPQLIAWLPRVRLEQAWAALVLVGLGMLQLGFTAHPLRTVLGLLTVLAGFEVLYAALERSALVAGLLAVVTLGLALIGAYLLVAPGEEAE